MITNLRMELFEAVVSSCDLVLCRDADQRLVLVAGRTGAHTITCTPAQLHYTPATRGITIQVTHVSHVAQCTVGEIRVFCPMSVLGVFIYLNYLPTVQ